MTDFERSSGVLLHITSLPSKFGIGDLGPAAFEWIDWLKGTGTRYWQILPLGPTGFGDSPYSSFSSYAGNPTLISPEELVQDGLLTATDLRTVGSTDEVDYDLVRKEKDALLRLAHGRLEGLMRLEFDAFVESERDWLEPFTSFMALKEVHGDASWTSWPPELRHRDPSALKRAVESLNAAIELHAFKQFVFYRQLWRLRAHAAEQGVEIIGDVPLYVAPDGVDVWMNPELFMVDPDTGSPTKVAGVPPDMFSDTGQLWGNPLYDWEVLRRDGFRWWFDRLEAFFHHADVIRIDHFTGLVKYYAIEGGADTAMNGVWRDGPGVEFFEEMTRRLGDRPIILEDLGPIGKTVEKARLEVGYPGMALVQEGIAGEPNSLPDEIGQDRVAYTGTHDNDTLLGRLRSETPAYRKKALAVAGGSEQTYVWDLLDRLWGSRAVITIAPMQDLLELGSEARMNRPGTAEGNWRWRMRSGAVSNRLAKRLAALNAEHGRAH